MKNSLNIPVILSVLFYITDVIFCFYSIAEKNRKLYILTKSLLMPLLLSVYLLFSLRQGGAAVQKFCVLSLIFHFAGDVCLLFPDIKGGRFMLAGIFSFFLGHVSYTACFADIPVRMSLRYSFITLFVMMLVEYFLYRQMMLSGSRRYAPVVFVYSSGLVMLAVSVSSLLEYSPTVIGPAVSLIGVFLFYFSDYCIARRIVRRPIAGQIVIMGTYIFAQTMIVSGLLLLQQAVF